jgi:hypothetical protein
MLKAELSAYQEPALRIRLDERKTLVMEEIYVR